MPSNIFKRKGTSRSPSSSSHGHGGITIAAVSPQNSNVQGSIAGCSRLNSSPSTIAMSLPPASDYRTSLIMPHLKRRFTLLRAPDGSMVTPDAMRAHLRAQRARARAAGTSGNQDFLTEEEENEIIDQLRRQASIEVEDLEKSQTDQSFSGTDGFGRWGSTPSSPAERSQRLDGFDSPLNRSINSHDNASIVGSLFSGRSSARDQAYISGVEKSRAASRDKEDVAGSNDSHSPGNVKAALEQVDELDDNDDINSEEAMPGDFLLATKRASQRDSKDEAKQSSNSSSSRKIEASQNTESNLLTTLSPEAYKRVSTALEEVYSIVAGQSSEKGDLQEESDAISRHVISSQSQNRPSVDSDSHSFASARSDVPMSAMPFTNSTMTDTTKSSLGASAMIPVDSSSTLKAVVSQEWSKAPKFTAPESASHFSHDTAGTQSIPAPSSFRSNDNGITRPIRSAKPGQVSIDTANGRMKRGPSSPNANTFNLEDKRSPKMSSNSVGHSYNNSNEYSLMNPLRAGFDQASLRSTKSSASSAAATAAGIAAAAYVAQHQEKSPQQQVNDRAATDNSPSTQQAPRVVTHQIVDTRRGEDSYDSNSSSKSKSHAILPSPSAAASSVLSAHAIAARSPRYFPTASAHSLQKYADGFRAPSTPTTPVTKEIPDQQRWVSQVVPPSSGYKLQQQAGVLDHNLANWSTPSTATAPLDSVEDRSVPRQAGIQSRQQETTIGSGIYASTKISSDAYVNARPGEAYSEYKGDGMDEDDVWARIAANNLVNDSSISGMSERDGLSRRSIQKEEPDISLDKLYEIQKSLVRSASSKGKGIVQRGSDSNSSIPAIPMLPKASPALTKSSIESKPSHKTSESIGSNSADSLYTLAKLEKARERAKMVANQQSQLQLQQSPQQQQPYSPLTASFDSPQYTSILSAIQFPEPPQMESRDSQSGTSNNSPLASRTTSGRDSSSFNATTPSPNGGLNQYAKPSRSQVMYDVTTSHRPTSPPPRSHKTSLSNLPSLQDLSLNATALSFALEAKHNSLDSMLESTNTTQDSNKLISSPLTRETGAIPEEEAGDIRSSMVEYEEVKVEDGFGGFTTERRPIIRSQSHDILSSMGRDKETERSLPRIPGAASPMTPNSIYSEPTGGQQNRSDSNPWSKPVGHQEALLYDNMLDDVAAQTKAATFALKGDHPIKPRLRARSKSLSRSSKKNWSKTISQPQLVSTSQKLEHTEEVPKIDRTLTKRDFKKHLEYGSLQQRKEVSPQSPTRELISPARSRSGSTGGQSAKGISSTPLRSQGLTSKGRSPSSNASSPTDYKAESKILLKAAGIETVGPGLLRKSNSFSQRANGHRAVSAKSDTPPASAPPLQNQTFIEASPESERSTNGLSRFMSKLRSRRPSESSLLASNAAALKSSPALSYYGTPSTSASIRSPTFATPGESNDLPSPRKEIDLSNESRNPTSVPAAPASLAGLFGPGVLPPRKSSARMTASRIVQNNGVNGNVLGSPAAIQEVWRARQSSAGDDTQILPTKNVEEMPLTNSARDTIVRRTIIISTGDGEDRKKSNLPARKLSIRKPVPTEDEMDKLEGTLCSSTLGNLARKSSHSEGTEKAPINSSELTPPVISNVSESSAGLNTSLAPPSPLSGSSNRISNANSEYGTSLYDMYMDNNGSEVTHQKLIPSSRQSLALIGDNNNDNGNSPAARHIEVTERADGSIVWQVIAGLADRSSTYSTSMPGETHSRIASGDSQYSNTNLSDDFPTQFGKGFSAINEDGRSLFARTKGQNRKSFSYDASNEPLPSLQANMSFQDQATSSGLDPANPSSATAATAAAAATRIVYTSDAELANMLESLTGPEKNSAKFEFHRISDEDGNVRPLSIWTDRQSQVTRATSNDNKSSERESRDDDIGGGGGDGNASIRSSMIDSKHRSRIEAEIYNLLQQDGHPESLAAAAVKQQSDRVNDSLPNHGNVTTNITTGPVEQVVV